MKKYRNKKGMAIIAALGVCFILLGLGTVLMINSYAHMTIAMGYFYDVEALNIAEGGVHYAIHELGKYANMGAIPGSVNYTDTLERGTFVTYAYNTNISKSAAVTVTDAFGNQRTIPPFSILIVSRGTVSGGGRQYSKIVEAIVHYQFVPQTLYSDGPVFINASNPGGAPVGNAMTLLLDANPDRFPSNIHSNCTSGYSYYNGTNTTLNLNGASIASSGTVGDGSVMAAALAGNGVPSGSVPTKQCVKITYQILEDKARSSGSWTKLDQNIPGIPLVGVDFRGKIKNEGGSLKAWIYVDLPWPLSGYHEWHDLEDYLPDGMKWNSSTNTLSVNKNAAYYWNKDLVINPSDTDSIINIVVAENKVSGLFVDGSITAKNVTIEAPAFTLATTDKPITLTNGSLHIYSPVNTQEVAMYGGTFSFTTSTDPFPGGNTFKGVLYTTRGEINLINRCTDPASNKITIEGLILNTDATGAGAKGVNVINNGLDGCTVNFKYNPYVTDAIFDYDNGSVYLQPVYWRIE